MRILPRYARPLLAIAALTLLASGCGKGTSNTAPGTAMTQGSADDFALQSVAALVTVGTDVEIAGGAAVGGPAPQTAVEPTGVTPGLSDTTFVKNGITFTISRTFYDGFNQPLSGYGPAAVRLECGSRAYGTWEGPRDTATVGHQAMLVVTGLGLAQDTLTFNGASLDTLLNRFRSYDGTRTRYFHWVSSLVLRDVRLLKSQLRDGVPLSGTVTFTVSADRLRSNNVTDVEAHLSATVVVTFNGTTTPDIVINGTWHYHWDMVTGTVVRA